MKRNVIIGVLVVMIMLIMLAPANLLRLVFAQVPGVALVEPLGTLWQGSGVIIAHPGLSANVTWQVKWQLGDSLIPTIHWQLNNSELSLRGKVNAGRSVQRVNIEGHFSGLALEPVLARYDISLPGTFQVSPTELLITTSGPAAEIELDKVRQLDWSGGNIRYVLSNGLEQAYVPALTANLKSAQGSLPTLFIELAENSEGPLLTLTPNREGYVDIKITRGFIELMGRTWTGSAKYNDVVLEVKRKVF